jgi:formate hydrogenlyase subunit 3/multisubunit Na+/H+ antiporter MnhD subunit
MTKRWTALNEWARYRRFSVFSAVIFALTWVSLILFTLEVLHPAMVEPLMNGLRSTFIGDALATLSQQKDLKLWIILTPVSGSFLQMVLGRFSDQRRDISIVLWTFITFGFGLLLYPQAVSRSVLTFEGILLTGLSFRADLLSFVMVLITTLIWLFVMMYSHHYMLHEQHRNRFYFFLSLTLSAILGTILAGDLLTMFLFFELMTLSSFMLVTHGESADSLSAGYQYLFIGVFGGILILLAIILQIITVRDLSFVPMAGRFAAIGGLKYVIMGLLLVGFGIKAGMAPVHIWLPRAHPVAPTPASALLSGIMIKIGAYGMLRVVLSFAFPEGSLAHLDNAWAFSEMLGYGLIWIGIGTMLVGVFFALQQSNAKKMLAYHSISQMGYILLGIGIMAYLGDQGSMGFAGALYHIVNHALFKSLLFMVVGILYLSIHEYDMYQMGGLIKRFPITAGIAFIACLGIAGVPLLNGFASKSLIHHALAKAMHHGHPSLVVVEWLFILISALTVTSFIKFFKTIFLGPIKSEHVTCSQSIRVMELAMAGLAILIVIIGLQPHLLLDHLIVPALRQHPFDPAIIAKYVVPLPFFAMKDLILMAQIITLGAVIFVLGVRYHWFHLKFSNAFTVEKILMYPVNKALQIYIQVRGKRLVDYWNAYNPYTEDKSMSALKQQGFVGRVFTFSNLLTRLYENDLIRNDAFIYAVVLTVVVGFLVWIL